MSLSSMHSLGFAVLCCWGCAAEPIEFPPAVCNASKTPGIEVANHDVYGAAPYALGYPPYAADGCSLLYVAPSADPNGQGELRLRDLAWNSETIIAKASTMPRRPVLAGDWIAWEADEQGRTLIHIQHQKDGNTIVLDGTFDHATEPRISSTAVVFTAWLGAAQNADTDIVVYDFATKTQETVGQGPGQQRFADISATHIAWSDFSEDPDGVFDENSFDIADIVVYDRQTQMISTRPRVGKQAFPMLGATGKLAFLDWNLVHPEPKLIAYDLRVADIADSLKDSVLVESIQTSMPYVRPVARGAFLEWVSLVDMTNSTLWRMDVNASIAPVQLQEPSTKNLFAPTASEHITFVGVQNADQSVALQPFGR